MAKRTVLNLSLALLGILSYAEISPRLLAQGPPQGKGSGKLMASPNVVYFTKTSSDTTLTQTVRIHRTGPPSQLNLTTSMTNVSGGAWLAVGPVSGESLPLTATPGSLTAGLYQTDVTVTQTGAGGTSVTINVFLRILTAAGGAPAAFVRPNSLSFRMTQGGANPDAKTLSVSSPTGGSTFTWSATRTITTPAAGTWLQIPVTTNAAGAGVLNVSIVGAGLGVGRYTGTITVTSGSSSVQVPVTLDVVAPETGAQGQGQPAAARLVVVPKALNFIVHPGGVAPAAKTLNVKSTGQGPVSWTATAMSTPSWLSILGAGGTTPGNIQVMVANFGSLTARSYEGKVQVTGGGRTETVRVFLRIVGSGSGGSGGGGGAGGATTNTGTTSSAVQISPRAIEFSATAGVVTPASAPLQLTSTVAGLTFTATRSTGQNLNWLNISSTSGAIPGQINVTVTLGSLGPGIYTGLITLNIAGSVTEQRLVLVTLRVSTAGETARLRVNPGGVAFQATRGGSNPAAKPVNVEAQGAASIPFVTTVSTVTGGAWLTVTPATPVTGTAPTTVNIGVNITNLAAGNYAGTVVFQASGGPGAIPATLSVNLSVAAPGAATSGLQGLFLAPAVEFLAALSGPTEVRVLVADGNGNPVDGAEVRVTSSGEDVPFALEGVGGGVYTGVLRNLTGGPVSLAATARSGETASAAFGVGGDLEGAAARSPVIFREGIVSTANFAPGPTPVAPGSILSIFGIGLADQTLAASSLPLPTELAGVRVLVGGIAAPLLAVAADAGSGSDQINFQLPVEAAAWTYADVVVVNNGVISDPEGIAILPGVPAVFTLNQQGIGAAAALHADFTLVSSAGPARAGETILIYATGLGAVRPPAITGQAPGALSNVAGNVEVRIGSRAAVVSFAGLAPGFVGLYQLNVVVPAGLPGGDAALELILDGITAGDGATVPIG